MKNFYYLIALITFALACIHFVAIQLSDLFWHNSYIVLYVYFPLITLLIHSVLLKQINKRPQLFINYFMGSMTIKLFLSMILLLVVLYTQPDVRISFALIFMFMYLVYTALSVVVLFKKLKQNS
ncbi:MAG: hypothetical protein CMC96_03045 [Flavobacteriales bacterium]|nr:hypothetical protein [Flavobacteriales bacterium]|tara:strand:+ start:34215 stop:34586 length:372 start_codon:yes stop_codon:yes gene_type:complete